MTDDGAIQGVHAAEAIEVWNQTELAAVIRRCAEAGRPIVDYGQFHRGLGHPPPADHVRLIHPTGVIEHDVSDMTVRVRAGTTLRELARHLLQHHQWLPLDGGEGTITIGEAIAHNVYGPLRCGFGALRDLLLGLKFMNGAGEEIAVGGRTVKNVAGYDVTKFMVGSLNTLGVLTEATLRTWAVPEQVTRVILPELPPAVLDRAMPALIASDASPTYLDLQQRAGEMPVTHLGYAGSPASCAAQFQALRDWLQQVSYDPKRAQADREDGSLIRDAAVRAQRIGWRPLADALVKLIVRPGTTAEALDALSSMDLPADTTLDALPMQGAIWLGGAWPARGVDGLDRALTALAERLDGVRIWLNRPADAAHLAPFAPAQSDWPILRALTRTFDGRQMFNPGRLFPREAPARSAATT